MTVTPSSLNIHVQEDTPQRRVLVIEGALTIHHVRVFEEALRKGKASTVILDLGGVPHMDSAALGALIHFYVSCNRSGRSLILVGVTPRVDQLLELTKIKALLIVIPKPEAAAEEQL